MESQGPAGESESRPGCKFCGVEVPEPTPGHRARDFCNEQHRQAYHRRARANRRKEATKKEFDGFKAMVLGAYSVAVLQPLQMIYMDQGEQAAQTAWRAGCLMVEEARAQWSQKKEVLVLRHRKGDRTNGS